MSRVGSLDVPLAVRPLASCTYDTYPNDPRTTKLVAGAFCIELTDVAPWVTMMIVRRQISFNDALRTAGALFLLAGLSLLTACAGVSNGNAHFTTTTTGQLTVAPVTLALGNVVVGSNATASGTLTAGNASVIVSAVTSDSSLFTVGLSLPVTIAAGQSVPFTVTFSPQTTGAATGTLTFTSNAQPSTTVETVTGTGTTTTTTRGVLSVAPATLGLGSVIDGSSGTAFGTLTASGASVTVSAASSNNSAFSIGGLSLPVTIAVGQSLPFTVTFSPQTPGAVTGTLTFTSDGQPSTTSETVTGTGTSTQTNGRLSVSPVTLGLGSVVDGSSGSASGTLTATGASVVVSAVNSSNSVFSVGGLSFPVTIAAGQSAPFTVTFRPQTPGAVTATLTFTSNAQPSTTVETVTGTGTSPTNGQLAVTPATLGLGSVVDGSSGSASGTLTASGASVIVSAASTNNSVFSVGGLSLPATIAAGQSVAFTVTFSPLTTGAVTATLTFTSNGQPSTTLETLTGTGTPAPTHTVNLSWNASTSSNISGYNIYRAAQSGSCGSFSKINATLNTGTVYADSTVINGTTYCYAATAVDTSNQESGYSNIASNVQIP